MSDFRASPPPRRRPYAPILALLLALLPLGSAAAFGLDDVAARAQEMAQKPYEAPKPIPQFMRDLSYDEFRSIRFDPKHSLWQDTNSRFQVMLVAPGRMFDHAVRINVVDGDQVQQVPFRKEYFSFGSESLRDRVPQDLGYAGFKLTFPLNRADVQDQFLVFAGASYFRGVAKGEAFGLSSRGAAIDTGLMTGEEFPSFVEYWLVRPKPDAQAMTVYALLDSPRLTGAYRFVVHPGAPTRIDTRAVLFSRDKMELLGVAPLTSMFFYGENTGRPTGNWRPEVHDSDGVLIHNGTGEWLWRPILNPKTLQVDSFLVDNINGFGLLQRDRRFEAYEDPEADYQRRPSAWVQFKNNRGAGRVVLVQIPTRDETNDNIVAFWSPREAFPGGQRLEVEYELSFGNAGHVVDEPLARAANTFVGRGDIMGGGAADGAYRLVVDFRGRPLERLPAGAPVEAVATAQEGGKVLEQTVHYVAATDSWRMSLLARPAKGKPLVLRAFLRDGDEALSETWNYQLPVRNSIRGDAQ